MMIIIDQNKKTINPNINSNDIEVLLFSRNNLFRISAISFILKRLNK